MTTTMDALASFDHLVNNLPLWLSKLEDLSVQVTKQHAQFMKLTHSNEVKLARQKTGSTESLRPQEGKEATIDQRHKAAEVTVTAVSVGEFQQSQTDHTLAVKEAQRERKPGSSPSAVSGPTKSRSRSMVIVYYDSYVQEAFELLVRNVATARNNLRKGKTAATFKARMASLGIGNNSFIAGGGRAMLDAKMMRLSQKTEFDPAADNGTSIFDAVDQDLEKAQSRCESAAHQFLRDGDCAEEIRTTRECFQKCLDVAQKEVDRLKEEKAQETPEEQDTGTDDAEPIPIDLSAKIEPPTVKPVDFAGIGTIEVDDDSSDLESIHIDMSAIRRTTRRI